LSIDKIIRKNTGSHYTPTSLSDFVATQILDDYQKRNRNKASLKIVDPAVGDGELLNSIVKICKERGFNKISVTGFDINIDAVEEARNLLAQYSYDTEISIRHEDFLDWVIVNKRNDLFSEFNQDCFDIVIANPPYVRTQVMGSEKSSLLTKEFGLSGRVDLYHAFLVAIERILKPEGVVGIIVSNRFLTTKSGESVRSHLTENFNISHIWDFGDTRLFKAAVLPAVLLMNKLSDTQKTITNFTSIYLNQATTVEPNDIFTALENNTPNDLFKITRGTLGECLDPKEVWFISNEESDTWLEKVNRNTKYLFSDLGKVRVGVKTTADKVFIVDREYNFPDGNPETLRPLTTHHIAKRYKAKKPIKNIVYTHHNQDGRKKVIDLSAYPKTKSYLDSHFDTLDKRTYIKESNRKWYEIWVPHNPSDWEKPKLVFRDISEKPIFWLEDGGNIVNGDCYWLMPFNDQSDDLLWLALAVANSQFIEEFYDRKFNNKLYSGRRRFITQYVEKFPLPDPSSSTASEIIDLVKILHSDPDSEKLEQYEVKMSQLVYKAFGF
jgi:SAM-dependent methyltransferase